MSAHPDDDDEGDDFEAFVVIPTWVILDKKVTAAEFKLLAVIAVHLDVEKGSSHDVLAEYLGLAPGSASRRRVRSLLQASIDKGYLACIPAKGEMPAHYHVRLHLADTPKNREIIEREARRHAR